MALTIVGGKSHLDHGLTGAHLEFIKKKYSDRDGFFIETLTLPEDLEPVESGLYGPLMGDEPIKDGVIEQVRGDREYASKCIDLPVRKTRLLTIIAGPHEEHKCMLYTSYGGPAAPREPGDPSLFKAEEVKAAEEFWSEHALAL